MTGRSNTPPTPPGPAGNLSGCRAGAPVLRTDLTTSSSPCPAFRSNWLAEEWSLVSFPTTDVTMPFRFRDAVLFDKPGFLGRDSLPANGANDGLRLPEEHRSLRYAIRVT